MNHARAGKWNGKRAAYLAAATCQMAVLFWLSSFPSQGDEPVNIFLRIMNAVPGGDKIAHGIAYALLGFLLTRGLGNRGWGIAVAITYGMLDEFHQSFVPGRDAGAADWIADSVGAILGSHLAGLKITDHFGTRGKRAAAREN